MGRFVLRRLAQGFLVIAGVVVTVFVVTRLIGDPVKLLLPLDATQHQRDVFRHLVGLDRPISVQFVDYVRHVSHLDFGNSLWLRRPAMSVIWSYLPHTLELVFLAIALAAVVGVTLGVMASLRPGSLLDRFTVGGSLLGLSMPQFWIGLLLIVVFAVKFHWFPTSGIGGPSHFVLPVITLALPAIGRITMITRSSMIDELNQQYVLTARAKGMSFGRVIGAHAFRNASVPALTMVGWELIRALAGYTVVVEVVFGWRGIGDLAFDSIQHQDLVLIQAIVMVVALMVVLVNIGIDVAYKAVDPRIKLA